MKKGGVQIPGAHASCSDTQLIASPLALGVERPLVLGGLYARDGREGLYEAKT